MNRFRVTDLPLEGLKLVQRKTLADLRGSFTRLFCLEELWAIWTGPIAQVNHTYTSTGGTIRGMHYQNPPHAEKKIVMCLRGEVWDVAVDLRAESPTFLQWHAEVLSAANERAMVIPEGFAHGFQTRTDDVEMLYFHSKKYSPADEGGLSPADPQLSIPWPLPIAGMSDRDREWPLISIQYKGIRI